MEREYLLDASALLAVIRNEPGADRVAALLDNSKVHAFNLAEVHRKLVSKGMPSAEVRSLLGGLSLIVVENFSEEEAYVAGEFAAAGAGLSLGDAVCLTTAKRLSMIAVTADRRWSEFADVQVMQLR